MDIIAEPANKGTLTLYPIFLSDVHNNQYRSGFSSITVLEETVNSDSFGTVFKPFSPFFEAFNEKIDHIVSSGMFSLWYKDGENAKGIKRVEDVIGPQVLTMEHLNVAFLVCFVPLAISGFAFAYEVIKNWFTTL